MNIKDLKKEEMDKIIDFYYHIEEYGHIFCFEAETLDLPFSKIMEGISEVEKLMDESYGY